jgi:hypothetical protein
MTYKATLHNRLGSHEPSLLNSALELPFRQAPSCRLAPMAGVKRTRDGTSNEKKSESDSPYIPMFETFRAELDEHHDRRERIVKASRDITAQSKKMYESL